MNRKLVLILVVLMSYGSFAFLFAKPVVANPLPSDDFTIRADGSIYPSTSLISTSDNVTYTLTGDIINDSILIERDNIVVDGADYIVEGTGSGNGISLSGSTNVTIKNMTIKAFILGIELDSSSYNSISGNNITNNWDGILLGYASSYNSISGNNITTSFYSGIRQYSPSINNTIYHNNFMNNTSQVYSATGSTNVWDNGYEGNYWSDCNGTDSNQDGIGDTPYVIDANNIDHYPLMGTFQSFNVSTWSHPDDGFEEVEVISNITISSLDLYGWLTTPNKYLQAGQIFLSLTPVQGQNMTTGFCRITLPNNILNISDYTVLIDLTPINASKLAISNNTYTTLYFTFNSSALDGIMIVPEFPSFVVLPLFMVVASLAVIVCKRKHLI